MSNQKYWIKFPNSDRASIAVPGNARLSDCLTIHNSQVLFGCRTGICGTCLIAIQGDIAPPDPAEQEILEIFAPDHPLARLACQIVVTSDLEILTFP